MGIVISCSVIVSEPENHVLLICKNCENEEKRGAA